MHTENIYAQTKDLFHGLIESNMKFRKIEICLIACSVSKVEGKKIDTIGDKKIAETICDVLWKNKPNDMWFAIQCCEHLNKCLIIEEDLARKLNLETVLVVPIDKAGGTFASTSYRYFKNPVIVEKIKADAGLDIGLNIIGGNLKDIPQPIITNIEYIGCARTIAARTRLKLIGGERAIYNTYESR